jgi:acetyl esterase/lipase
MRIGMILALALVTGYLTPCWPAYPDKWPENTGKILVQQDLVYGTGGGRELKLTLISPKQGKGPFPAVVFVHGGGWRAGSPYHFSRQARILAENGYIGACIEYRLSAEAAFPAAIEDVKCAVRWLRAHAAQYGVNEKKIAVSGGSAGGHLSLLAGTSGGVNELEGSGGWSGYSSRVQLVVAFNPACKFAGKTMQPFVQFIGVPYVENPELYWRAEPASYIDSSDPPMLLLHATGDKTIPYAESVEFVSLLRTAGVNAELYTDEGPGHGWFNDEPYFTPTSRALADFLDKYFK